MDQPDQYQSTQRRYTQTNLQEAEASLLIKPIETEREEQQPPAQVHEDQEPTKKAMPSLDEIISDAAAAKSGDPENSEARNGDISNLISPFEESQRLKLLMMEAQLS